MIWFRQRVANSETMLDGAPVCVFRHKCCLRSVEAASDHAPHESCAHNSDCTHAFDDVKPVVLKKTVPLPLANREPFVCARVQNNVMGFVSAIHEFEECRRQKVAKHMKKGDVWFDS